MTSIKCLSCGFVSWADHETCKKCGASLTAPAEVPSSRQPAHPNHQSSPDGFWQKRWKMRFAVNTATIGAINLATFGGAGVGAIAGVIVALVALKKIEQRPDRYSGRGFAIAGLAMSIVSVVLGMSTLIIILIAIPRMLATKRAVKENSAIFCLQRIRAAETSFQNTRKKYGTLEELFAERLIDAGLASGERDGYKFKVIVSSYGRSGSPEFDALASPANYPSSGYRSFLIDETGVIHAADSKYGDASRSDAPLEERRAYLRDDD